MRRRRPSPAWAVGLAALALLAMLGKAGAETLLRTRLNADIRSTDPGTNRDANTDAVVAHVVEGLVAFRDDTSIGPMLAAPVLSVVASVGNEDSPPSTSTRLAPGTAAAPS